VLNQVEEIGCEAIQFRFFNPLQKEKLEIIQNNLSDSCIVFSEIIGGFNDSLETEYLIAFLENNERIRRIVIHSANKSEIIIIGKGKYSQKIIFITQNISSHEFCGIINESLFAVNITSFTESLHFNSCLNRKLSIDVTGSIKNCPSMDISFGNITEIKLKDVLLINEIKQFWSINKDLIDVCKDCEFRYICTDCRAYIQDKNNIYSKPAKCNYDPYNAEWY
jgi:SPASM domain peptide maturase of grasp-with-spasm system